MNQPANKSGFTLVEIMVVVVIIGLLAAIALPLGHRMRQNAQANRLSHDIKRYAAAYQQYNLEHGVWPEVGGVSEVPPGMEGVLPSNYVEVSPVGGGFTWSGQSARLRLTNHTADEGSMRRVDANVDDGDLSTGQFTKTGNDYQLQL